MLWSVRQSDGFQPPSVPAPRSLDTIPDLCSAIQLLSGYCKPEKEVATMPASMIVLVAMTVVVAIIAVYRWIVTHHEDDFLHIEDPDGHLIANQRNTARALTQVDRIGIGLTIVTAVYGVGLLAAYLWAGLSR